MIIELDSFALFVCGCEADRRTSNRTSYRPGNDWGAGNIAGASATDVVELGCVGEFAFYRWAVAIFPDFPKPDFGLRESGDRGIDFSFAGVDIDVKIRSPRSSGRRFIVRTDKLHDSIVYVFARRLDQYRVDLRGFRFGKRIRELATVKPGKRPGWSNYEIDARDLRSLKELESGLRSNQ